MNHSENRGIYDAYENESTSTPESSLCPETQRYIDDNIIPVVKTNPSLATGMRSYLYSQGIFEPAAVPYINQRLK